MGAGACGRLGQIRVGTNSLGVPRGVNCRVWVTPINAVEERLVFQIEGPGCGAWDGLSKSYDLVVTNGAAALDRAGDSRVGKSGKAQSLEKLHGGYVEEAVVLDRGEHTTRLGKGAPGFFISILEPKLTCSVAISNDESQCKK